ncbi:hypothetical protein HYH03_013338 [Edaphochlamys debaryana]|uniref:DUF7605 domain-containing protein n=1 Tax=Edaphochlamys debaryana TaxID=47281 RepID=A0A835XR37_9CHLO|nr:hypothetical protein HYH03_013338 [Edaphochlamys debaryana]|eukprot:KAG2488032.1 hypothetical protein HYH03_013338 [Edaphochlamys debaryana]
MRLFSNGSSPGTLADGSTFDTLAVSSQAFVLAAEGKPRALSVELARNGTAARATLLVRSVAAWKRGEDGAITRLRMAVGIELQVGDELILASASVVAPPEDAKLAFAVTDDSSGDAGPDSAPEQAETRPPAPLRAMDVDQPSTHAQPGPNHEQPLSGQTLQQPLPAALPSPPPAAAPPSPIRQPSPPPPERTPLPRTASDIREGRAPLVKGEPLEAPTGILAGTQLPSALGPAPVPQPIPGPAPSPAVAPTPAPAPKPAPARDDHTPAPGTAPAPKPEARLTPSAGPTPAAAIKPAATPATGPASTAPKSAAKGPGALMEDVREVLQGMGAVLKLQGASSGNGQGPSDAGPAAAGAGGAEAAAAEGEDDPSDLAAPKLAGPEMLSQWQGEWSGLLGKCSNPKALIGFLGGTGAGKSSLINGLLGEENIYCMRATTACVILVEYSEDRAYEAAIECLTEEEWAAQRLQALEDMRGDDGLVGIICGESGVDEATLHNNARAAQDTLEAVCGRDMVRSLGGLRVNACVAKLQGVANEVTRLLGTTVRIRETKKAVFRSAVGRYVDSSHCKTAARRLDRLQRDARFIRRRVGELCEAQGLELPEELGELMEGVPEVEDEREEEVAEHEEEEEGQQEGEQDEEMEERRDEDEDDEDLYLQEDDEDGGREPPAHAAGEQHGAGDKRKRAAGEDDDMLPVSKRAAKIAGMETVAELMSELVKVAADVRKTCVRHAQLVKEAGEAAAAHALAAQEVPPLLLRVRSICAAARNAYVKKRMQQDYREGMVEVAKAAGGDNAAAAKFARKGSALPVFCVSTRDALTLEGRVRSEDRASTFERVAQTELPLLREHIRAVATAAHEKAQSEVAGQVLKWGNSAGRALLSQRVEGSADAADAMRAACGEQLKALERTLTGILDEQLGSLRYELLTESLCPSLEAGGELANEQAPATANGWFGSMHWCTYITAIRKEGDFKSPKRGPIDFNGDLAGPILDRVALCWNELFNSRLGEVLESAKLQLLEAVDAFCGAIATAAERCGLDSGPVVDLCIQVRQDAERLLDARLGPLATHVTETAIELSSNVVKPAVKGMLRPTYSAASQDCGPGSVARRRAMLESAVKELATTRQFKAAAGALERKVMLLLDHVDKTLRRALPAMARAAKTRLALLWDEAPASYAQRYRAAAALRDLLEKLRAACDRAKHTLGGETCDLPEPPVASPQAARAEAAAEAAAGEAQDAGAPGAAAQGPESGGEGGSRGGCEPMQEDEDEGRGTEEGEGAPGTATEAAEQRGSHCDSATEGCVGKPEMEGAGVEAREALATCAASGLEEGAATAVHMELELGPLAGV